MGATPQSPPAGWEDILDPGETILWQGRPEARLDWSRLMSFQMLQGLGMAVFALAWMVIASGLTFGRVSAFNLVFMLFGLPILIKGLVTAFGPQVKTFLRLRGSFYTLTDRNAFIASEILGRKHLERYPRDSSFRPVLEVGLPGSVWFGLRDIDARSLYWFDLPKFFQSLDPHERRVGFENIEEARRVFRLMSDPPGTGSGRGGEPGGET